MQIVCSFVAESRDSPLQSAVRMGVGKPHIPDLSYEGSGVVHGLQNCSKKSLLPRRGSRGETGTAAGSCPHRQHLLFQYVFLYKKN
ncbi:MAG: hypothetical protein Greene101449_1300 [Candidatus Peregrinibacteria bacterium Greene1014_49]|nr:MAG: hypothetical protein Greene101449_1300 [Candidatus Peregrinibacteria bacterium Greene1014_49]